MKKICLLGLLLSSVAGCFSGSKDETLNAAKPKDTIVENKKPLANKFTGKKVPVLCYHAIREIENGDSADQKAYSISPANFESQIKALADAGYTSITPDQLNGFLTKGEALPEKPVMITFDDGRKDQFSIGATTLDKYNFKGVFYIMTVSLGKKRYMSKDDVRSLSDNGHVIGCHTWDHNKVTNYKDDDWTLQLVKPKQQLEKITEKPVTSFAYPYGLWNQTATDSLKSFGYTTAFIFYGKQDLSRPLYTLERIAAPNSTKNFLEKIEKAVN